MNDDPLLKGKSDFYRLGERRGFQVLGIQGRFANPETDIFSLNKVGLNKVCSPPYSTFAGLWVLTDWRDLQRSERPSLSWNVFTYRSTTAIIIIIKKSAKKPCQLPALVFESLHTTLPHGWLKGAVNFKRLTSQKQTSENSCECILQASFVWGGSPVLNAPNSSSLGTLQRALKLALGQTSEYTSWIA